MGVVTPEVIEAPYLRGDPIFGRARAFRDDPLGFIEPARGERGDFKEGYEHNEPLTGRALLTSGGDFWRRQRRSAQPAFRKERLKGMAKTNDRLHRGGNEPQAAPGRGDDLPGRKAT